MTVERAVGWWLACAVHPQAAWRILRAKGRAMLIGTYFGAGYITALLLLLSR